MLASIPWLQSALNFLPDRILILKVVPKYLNSSTISKELLSVFENGVLWRILGPKREEVTGEWRKLNSEQPNDLYTSRNFVRVIKSRRMRLAGRVARMVKRRGVYGVLVRKPDWKRPLGRPRRRWEDNIKMDLYEVGCGSMDWIQLAQGRDRWRALVNAVMNLRVP